MSVHDKNSCVTYPVVVVEVNGIRCRALLDTGAGSSYASASLLSELKLNPCHKEYKRIEMMLGSTTKLLSVYELNIKSVDRKFDLKAEVTGVDRDVLLTLHNPRYQDIIEKYTHLSDLEMTDRDEKSNLPVHIILGTSEYARIKTPNKPRIGRPGEPIAELTKFGWTILSPGKEVDLNNMFLTQVSEADYNALCSLDVLGLLDIQSEVDVYEDFKKQLTRSDEGWYETGLPWKQAHPELPTNKEGSLKRLDSLLPRLERQNILEMYDEVIKDQLAQNIIERVTSEPVGREVYIPHKPVIRESAESTRIRIVYDASARARRNVPSLNDCLETGPPLQNYMWNVLARNRFRAVAVVGDIKQAFLQVRIQEGDRDAMRFHWLSDLHTRKVEVLRFTCALFGLAPSPFLLAGVIREHLQKYKENCPDVVSEIEKSLYVDDLISGADTTLQAQQLKQSAIQILGDAKFTLHKWHSNVQALEIESGTETSIEREELSFAKQQLGANSGETKLLGLPWEKESDTLSIVFPKDEVTKTKRGILGKIARVYDPLGLVSPTTLVGKQLYRDACDQRVAWDEPLPPQLLERWVKWESLLPNQVRVPRSLAKPEEPIDAIDIHVFGDASREGVSAAVYTVIHQPSGNSKGLVAAKARLAKKSLTIPHLELVSAHMAANITQNLIQAIEGLPIKNVVG